MMDPLQLEFVKAGLTLGTHVLTAILLYFVARYLTERWNEQKKQNEIAMLQESQSAQKQRELQLLATKQLESVDVRCLRIKAQINAAVDIQIKHCAISRWLDVRADTDVCIL